MSVHLKSSKQGSPVNLVFGDVKADYYILSNIYQPTYLNEEIPNEIKRYLKLFHAVQ
jgi:hypothetical protein